MKGAVEPLSIIIMTGILISLIGTVYFWGLPLIQKHEDISIIRNAETFMINLENKIKSVVNVGGSDSIELTVPKSTLIYDGNKIVLEVETTGTSYAESAVIPLGRNECTLSEGIWGINSFSILCVTSNCLSSVGNRCNKYLTTYELSYIKLNSEIGFDSYQVQFVAPGRTLYGGEKNSVLIKNNGYTESFVGGRNLISSLIEINII